MSFPAAFPPPKTAFGKMPDAAAKMAALPHPSIAIPETEST